MKTNPAVFVIEETTELAVALDKASLLWPELEGQRTQLIHKILEAGIREIEREPSKFSSNRIAAVQSLAGSMDDVWPENWKEELSEGWQK
jgi:hypothetical protein